MLGIFRSASVQIFSDTEHGHTHSKLSWGWDQSKHKYHDSYIPYNQLNVILHNVYSICFDYNLSHEFSWLASCQFLKIAEFWSILDINLLRN